MAGLASIGADDALAVIDRLTAELAEEPAKDQLVALHDALIQVAAGDDAVPDAVLAAAGRALAGIDSTLIEALPTRPRVALRLLQAGVPGAASMVLADNATGVVTVPFRAATSSGAPRTSWRLPILTVVESGRIFADLPGFRDPRFAPPDECYDVSAAVKLRGHLDDAVVGRRLALAGWAAIDLIRTSADDRVRVVATKGEQEVSWPAIRHRRADLGSGTGEGLHRRVWAGWSAQLDVRPLMRSKGAWSLSLDVEQAGLSRRSRLGSSVGELAAGAAGQLWRSARPKIRIDARKAGWVLVVS